MAILADSSVTALVITNEILLLKDLTTQKNFLLKLIVY